LHAARKHFQAAENRLVKRKSPRRAFCPQNKPSLLASLAVILLSAVVRSYLPDYLGDSPEGVLGANGSSCVSRLTPTTAGLLI
jgi:hypothetical protein